MWWLLNLHLFPNARWAETDCTTQICQKSSLSSSWQKWLPLSVFSTLAKVCSITQSISYLLLYNKFSNHSRLKQQTVIVSCSFWGSGFREWLGWFKLRISHEIAVKMAAEATVIWRLLWAGELASKFTHLAIDKRPPIVTTCAYP